MAAPAKDTIYIDIDDEITGIIDKLRASKGKVVALVLPKRATVLQSIVNMKLLKRAATDSKKSVVLITTEAGLLPLAGASGMYVASSLNSKPEIPSAPANDEDEEMVDEDAHDIPEEDHEITAKTAGAVAVGALAGLPPKTDEVETLELDDDDAETSTEQTPATADKPKKPKKDAKLKVPNFERFRLLLIIGGALLILMIVLAITGNRVLPKATITIKTDASVVNSTLALNLSTTATKLDLSNNTLPAKQVTIKKTYTQQANATGQQNNGTKASGTVNMTAKECGVVSPSDVPAGTGISSGGLTYITQGNTSFVYDHISGGCIFFKASSATSIVAQKGGANYNVASGTTFAVAGRSDVTATGSASGGTDNIVTVVSQSDIDNAKNKINIEDQSVKTDLQNQLKQAGYYAMPVTYSTGTPTVTTSANAGDAAANVTVTEVVTYTMMGVHEADLKAAVDNSVKSQIDIGKQSVLDQGLGTATYNLQSATDTTAQVAMQTAVVIGPKLDEDQIKEQVAGQKSGAAVAELEQNPDVTDVTVKLSPFWVSSIPKNTKKITVVIEKPSKSINTSNNADNNP